MSYIEFVEVGRSRSNKTILWNVLDTKNKRTLCGIAWYPGWRKYVMFTRPDAIFDAECLNEISTFLDLKNDKR